MVWLLIVFGVIAFLIFGALYIELRPDRRGKKFDKWTDSATNHQAIRSMSNNTRNK